ncbi:MAG: L-serine ammonia-lyase [Alphaproteobacteria bacterium]|nr:L-serine ammonia-lyase [Alphaproteobacteria bacterium]
MFLSVFDIFKVGIGPSSSHTMGPMVAAGRFLDVIRNGITIPGSGPPAAVRCSLHGSLAWTGKGHATDRAVILGLAGHLPARIDPDRIADIETFVHRHGRVEPEGLPPLAFVPAQDLTFDFDVALPGHANGMIFSCFDANGRLRNREIYYSTGGGFVVTEQELQDADTSPDAVQSEQADAGFPYPFATAGDMLAMGERSGLSIAAMKLANETRASGHHETIARGLHEIIAAMDDCIDRGLANDGELPGKLKVRRRAKAIHERLLAERGLNIAQPHAINDWLIVYAMAVNEENAAGGRVVTSPTNGAAGVVPSVLRYYRDHCLGANADGVRDFMLTAAAIGGIIKHNASISGAEVGCQGEVGSAAAMAAAGLCAALGGTNAQIENAAEIALEHHLGMTCDPVGGLVQIPCIERNGLGAIKAVSAASLALRGDGTHVVPLDACIETLRQTGRDMDEKYKETSRGGLAVNLPEC